MLESIWPCCGSLLSIGGNPTQILAGDNLRRLLVVGLSPSSPTQFILPLSTGCKNDFPIPGSGLPVTATAPQYLYWRQWGELITYPWIVNSLQSGSMWYISARISPKNCPAQDEAMAKAMKRFQLPLVTHKR